VNLLHQAVHFGRSGRVPGFSVLTLLGVLQRRRKTESPLNEIKGMMMDIRRLNLMMCVMMLSRKGACRGLLPFIDVVKEVKRGEIADILSILSLVSSAHSE